MLCYVLSKPEIYRISFIILGHIMNKNLKGKAVYMIAVSLLVIQSNTVFSHQLINSLTAAHAVDLHLVTCAETDNHHLYVQIDDLKVIDTRQFNVLVVKDKVISSTTNPDGKSSSVIRVLGGAGVYQAYISQTAGGEKAANYQLVFHCEDIDNTHFETSSFLKIDQP